MTTKVQEAVGLAQPISELEQQLKLLEKGALKSPIILSILDSANPL
jgi:hypothetical protein